MGLDDLNKVGRLQKYCTNESRLIHDRRRDSLPMTGDVTICELPEMTRFYRERAKKKPQKGMVLCRMSPLNKFGDILYKEIMMRCG